MDSEPVDKYSYFKDPKMLSQLKRIQKYIKVIFYSFLKFLMKTTSNILLGLVKNEINDDPMADPK